MAGCRRHHGFPIPSISGTARACISQSDSRADNDTAARTCRNPGGIATRSIEWYHRRCPDYVNQLFGGNDRLAHSIYVGGFINGGSADNDTAARTC